jgi:hypothetical protein
MRTLSKRLRKLEESHSSHRHHGGLTPADVVRQRMCRRQAAETGRPYEELLREHIAESEAFWESYDGERSLAGILRSRYKTRTAQPATPGEMKS